MYVSVCPSQVNLLSFCHFLMYTWNRCNIVHHIAIFNLHILNVHLSITHFYYYVCTILRILEVWADWPDLAELESYDWYMLQNVVDYCSQFTFILLLLLRCVVSKGITGWLDDSWTHVVYIYLFTLLSFKKTTLIWTVLLIYHFILYIFLQYFSIYQYSSLNISWMNISLYLSFIFFFVHLI